MMNFLTFPCLAIHQSMYSFPLGEWCPTLCQGFCAPSFFGMLLHSSQSWLRFSDSSEKPSCWLMWAQLYEKQMGTDWKKTFPSSIQAQAHQANRLFSLHQQKKQHVLDLIHLDLSVVQFCATGQQKHRHIPAWYFPLCVRHITKQMQKKNHFAPYRKNTNLNYQLSSMHFVGLISDSLQLFFFFPQCCIWLHTEQHLTAALLSPQLH